MKMNKNDRSVSVRNLTLAAMLTAMSVVIGIFCKSFMNFGMGLFRITFENLPIILSGIAFGPIVGALVGAASDLTSYFLSPQTYPPNLIVTAGATAVGALSGITSIICSKSSVKVRIILSASLAHLVGSMIIKPIGLYAFYGPLVLWRIPLYLLIAPLEIFLIILLYKKSPLKKLIDRSGRKRD